MTIDISKIRPGDEVTVRAVVVHQSRALDQWQLCWPDHPGATLWAFPEHIVSHTPKELQPGDRVKVGAATSGDWLWAGREARLVAVDGKDAWVASDDGEHLTVGADRLERVQ